MQRYIIFFMALGALAFDLNAQTPPPGAPAGTNSGSNVAVPRRTRAFTGPTNNPPISVPPPAVSTLPQSPTTLPPAAATLPEAAVTLQDATISPPQADAAPTGEPSPLTPPGANATPGTNRTTRPFPAPGVQPLAAGTNINQTTVIAPNLGNPIPPALPGIVTTNEAGAPSVRPSQARTVPTRRGLTNANTFPAPPGGSRVTASGAATNVVAPVITLPDDEEAPIQAQTIALQGMPLDQFLEVYAQYARRTVLKAFNLPQAPGGYGLSPVTDLTRREVVQALDGVLALNGITMIPSGEKFVKAVPSTQAVQEGSAINNDDIASLPDSEQFVTRIVKLKTSKPSEIAPLFATFTKNPSAITPIDSNNTLILRDVSSNVRRMLEIIEKVDVTAESDFTLEVIPIRYGKVGDIYETMNALITGAAAPSLSQRSGVGGIGASGGAFRGGTGNRAGSLNSSSRGGYSGGMNSGGYGGGGYGGAGGYYPMSDSVEELFPMQARAPSAAANQGNFQQRLNQIVSRAAGGPEEIVVLENARIVPDERSNKLLIYANKRDMGMITNIVAKVDTLLAQVLIEAVIMEVGVNDGYNVGVSLAQKQKRFGGDFTGQGASVNGANFLNNITNFPSGAPGGFSYFGAVGDNLDFAINAIAEDGDAKVVSRPRIQTSHAIPGNFFLGETVPYITGFTDYGGVVGGGLSTRSSVSQAEIGFNLFVTPFITPDGLVVMEISQSFDTRGADVDIDNNPVPIINKRMADSTLTVRTGDTIMMGGFISQSRNTSKSGIPLLKDIPGIGALFRSKKNEEKRTELIVLMRATVLETPEAAAIHASAEKASLPGIVATEKEFQAENEKRLKKARKK